MTEKEINERSINIWFDAFENLMPRKKQQRTFEMLQDSLTHAENTVWQLKDLYDTAVTSQLRLSIKRLAMSLRNYMRRAKDGYRDQA